jgi:hypothetical protein
MESCGFKIGHGMEELSLDSVHATDASSLLPDSVVPVVEVVPAMEEASDSEEKTPQVVPVVEVEPAVEPRQAKQNPRHAATLHAPQCHAKCSK